MDLISKTPNVNTINIDIVNIIINIISHETPRLCKASKDKIIPMIAPITPIIVPINVNFFLLFLCPIYDVSIMSELCKI